MWRILSLYWNLMMKQFFLLACVSSLFLATVGCEGSASSGSKDSDSATKQGESGINIEWPGGSVKVDPKTGDTRVDANGVEVDAGLGRGARVRTPKVDVDASAQGVDVQAPA